MYTFLCTINVYASFDRYVEITLLNFRLETSTNIWDIGRENSKTQKDHTEKQSGNKVTKHLSRKTGVNLFSAKK